MFITLFGITILMFVLIQVIPGGPVDRIMQRVKFSATGTSSANSQISEEFRQQLIEHYGFDKPVLTRYILWLKDLSKGDLGQSYEYHEPVFDVIASKLPVSLSFGIFSFILVYLLSIPLGILKAIFNGSKFDILSSFLLFLGYSIPSFALSIGLMLLFSGGSFFTWFPFQGLTSDNFRELSLVAKVLDYLHHMVLPLTAYVIGSFAMSTILMKNSYLEQQHMDYVRTATAKGLSNKSIAVFHVMKNSLTPIATQLSEFPALFLMGSILVELIFGLDGIGLLNYESIMARDYPVVLAIILFASIAQIIGVMLSDFLYVILDPRVNYSKV